MWQITLEEILTYSFPPNGKTNWRNGISDWFCPVCGMCVGIYSDGSTHDKGWLYKRETCQNGHRIDWRDI